MTFPQTDTNYPIYLPDGSVVINPLNVQTGGYVVPDAGVIARHVQDVNATQLNPTSLYTVVGQASKPNLILVSNPTGCDKPTMQEMPGIIPPVTMQLVDSYGIDIPGAFSTAPGSSIQVLETTPGHPTALGTQGADNTRLPFLTDAYLLAPLKSLPYGMYPFTLDGKTYPSLGTPDPTVNKPEYWLDYDPAHFYVTDSGQLGIITDGNAGAYAAGQGIKFVPGDSPVTAPGIVVNTGGAVDVGPHFYWYSWTYPAAVGTVDSALSPSAYAKTDTGHKSVDVSTPAKPVGSAATGLKIWRTSVADPSTPKLLTTIGTTGAQTYTDTTADSGLGAAHVVSQTQISARPDGVTIDFNIKGELETKGGGPFAYDASFAHTTDHLSDPALRDIDQKIITAFEQAHYGGDFIWGYGIKNASNDHGIVGAVDMDAGDGYDTMFCLIPIKDWSSYSLFGLDADTFPNYHGSGAALALDGSIHAAGSIVIGKASGISGSGRATYPADYSVICVFDGAVTLGNSHDNYGHTIYGDVQFSGGSISLIAGATFGALAASGGTSTGVGGTATSGKGVSGTASTGIPIYGNLTGAGTRVASFANAGTEVAGFDNNGTLLYSGTGQTTAPTGAGASALPATPSEYIPVVFNGTTYLIPAYLP